MPDDAADLEETLSRHTGEPVETTARPQTVPVNVYETTEALVVVAPLPGVMADDITIEIDGTRVTLRAGMRSSAPKDYLLHEWTYGPYERALDLPEGFGGEATASFGNGQLAVRLTRGEAFPGARTVTPAG